ncbi:DUF2953 domain-containing protein (plasmid) [Leisingera aquaemixtae]|uniref:DUF2953 domain-containing protein n=1 Tax=Leisingera aquaemixtae TaxID=1396826 RepID=UPI0021A966CE|nr:DUF2953 domain-containing protein [Leisingera aquaemixtae]UWQ27139.1 DUF2953 domain-containing protein [Leisingera aquaemixtae]
MAGLGAALAVLLAALLGLTVLVLVLPLRIELVLRKEAGLSFSAALRPFGGIGPRIRLSGRRKPPETAQEPGRKRRYDPRRLAPAAGRLAAAVLRRIRIRALVLDAKFGLGDPAETGQLYGMLAPLVYGTLPARRLQVAVQPVFDRAELSGRAELDVTVVPAALIVPAVRFGWDAFGPVR